MQVISIYDEHWVGCAHVSAWGALMDSGYIEAPALSARYRDQTRKGLMAVRAVVSLDHLVYD